ncbi:hypothetical protein Tco_0308299 [Tanacetum coccineum]
MATEVPQTLKYRGGQLNAAPMLEVENFTNWKKRFMCHIIGIEPQFENIISNGPFIPMAAGQRKPDAQWTTDERKAANLDQRLKSLINCLTTKSTWNDLILYHEGPFDVKESRVMDLKLCYNTFKFKEGESLTQTFTRYKALMNELVNDGVKLSKLEINTGFINGLPKKWLASCQSLRNINHVKKSKLASLFGKLKYEENLINSIYDPDNEKTLVHATPLSIAFLSTSIVKEFQESPDDEEDTRSSQEYINDLEEEYQARALLAQSKRFFKNSTQRFSSAKATDQTECHKCRKKGHFASDYWSKTSDKEEVSSHDNEVTEVKVLMALADEERVYVGKESARNGEWIRISMKKVHTLLEMEDNDDKKSFLDYLCIDFNYVEEQRCNLLSKHKNLVQELNTCKEQLLVLKQAKLNLLTIQHVNTEILKENQNLRNELKELNSIIESWLNSSNKVNQCISEQIPTQKKKILGINQLTENTSSFWPNDSVFVMSSVDNSDLSISICNKPKLSEADKVSLVESQRNTTVPSVTVTESSATNDDSDDESSVCSTPLPSLKLDDAKPVSNQRPSNQF